MSKNDSSEKIIAGLAIGFASLCLLDGNGNSAGYTSSSSYHNRKIETNTVNDGISDRIKNVFSRNYGRRKSLFGKRHNSEYLIDYAERLSVSSKAMPLDDIVDILDKEYAASWPEHPIDEKYFLATMSIESGFNPRAYNSRGNATGLAGFLPSTWRSHSDKPFKYAKDPEENIKALISLTKDNLSYLKENHPKWDNLSELEQYIQLGLAHSAGASRMKHARFNPYNIHTGWIRKQSINYQAKMKDYLTR